jgi:hypothetical protein
MDSVSAARTARENLARGLGALQSPGVPPQLLAAADPVAQAMSALHRIETSGGAAIGEAAPAALACVRQALALLQAQPFAHPAIDQGMEAIAGSLGIVHQLTQGYGQPPTQPAGPAQHAVQAHAQYAAHGHAPPPGPEAVSPFAGTLMVEAQPPGQPAPGPGPAGGSPLTQPSRNLPYGGRPEPKPQVAYVTPGTGAQPQRPAQGWSQPQQPAHGGAQGAAQVSGPHVSTLASAGQGSGYQRVEAALGAHSTTNFYKGLSGNDIIESGGIFIATYQIPRIGSNLLIHVSLPGGYEFEAAAVVRWTRESSQAGSDAPPGFGAQFTQISPEGRQLVYRYVRNREPLFHDDF